MAFLNLNPFNFSFFVPDELCCKSNGNIPKEPSTHDSCQQIFDEIEIKKIKDLHGKCPECNKKINKIFKAKDVHKQLFQFFSQVRKKELISRVATGVINGGLATLCLRIATTQFETFEKFQHLAPHTSTHIGITLLVSSCLLFLASSKSIKKIKTAIVGAYGASIWLGGNLANIFMETDPGERNRFFIDTLFSTMCVGICSFAAFEKKFDLSEIEFKP
jgi:hypothetical protein